MGEYTQAKKPRRKPLGRNQLIGLGALAVPFGFATAWVFLGKATFGEWASFVQLQSPIMLGIILGASAAVKLRGGQKQ